MIRFAILTIFVAVFITQTVLTVFITVALLQQKVVANCADGTTPGRAAESCFAIYDYNPRSPSGLYYVNVKNQSGTNGPIRVYCDMETCRCGVKGGWMLVTSLDMKNSAHNCPSHFKQENSGGKRLCVKKVPTGCSSQTYSIGGVPYAEVCGKAIGYAYGSPDAAPYPVGTYRSIEEAYMDGISITHGSTPRKHIWTYIGGFTDDNSYKHVHNCPCAAKGIPLSYNNFVGNHFYCESGNPSKHWQSIWYLNDTLWDGAGCPAGNSCCTNSGLPYFYRTLPRVTTDDIEVRLCADQPRYDEDVGLEELELYVR